MSTIETKRATRHRPRGGATPQTLYRGGDGHAKTHVTVDFSDTAAAVSTLQLAGSVRGQVRALDQGSPVSFRTVERPVISRASNKTAGVGPIVGRDPQLGALTEALRRLEKRDSADRRAQW